jgi:phage shock protein A
MVTTMLLSEILPTNALEGLIAAALGGGAVRLLDKLLARRNENFNEAERLRAELREELETLRTDIIRLEQEVESWKQRYWIEYENAAKARLDIALLQAHIGVSGSLDLD